MDKEIERNQLNQILLHINRLIHDLCAVKTGQYPPKDYIWNKETEQKWGLLHSRLLTTLQREDFADVLGILNEGLEELRHDPK